MKHCHVMCCYERVITRIELLVGAAPSKFGRAKKRHKLGAIYDNFRL